MDVRQPGLSSCCLTLEVQVGGSATARRILGRMLGAHRLVREGKSGRAHEGSVGCSAIHGSLQETLVAKPQARNPRHKHHDP